MINWSMKNHNNNQSINQSNRVIYTLLAKSAVLKATFWTKAGLLGDAPGTGLCSVVWESKLLREQQSVESSLSTSVSLPVSSCSALGEISTSSKNTMALVLSLNMSLGEWTQKLGFIRWRQGGLVASCENRQIVCLLLREAEKLSAKLSWQTTSVMSQDLSY